MVHFPEFRDFYQSGHSAASVTRCVFEKIAQNVAQPVFIQNKCTTFTVENSGRNILVHFCNLKKTTRGRCYDHNFLQISTIFGEKIRILLKNHFSDQKLLNLALFSVKNVNLLLNFPAKIFKKS
jgi:hypothetical protein